jgi:lipoyl(octanoyl) transferase
MHALPASASLPETAAHAGALAGPALATVRQLGGVAYAPVFEAMRRFTEARTDDTPDEIWLCEHAPVYTQGVAGRAEHLLAPGDIPVVQSNRGGQVTYHGPGQVVAYPLIDLRRQGLYVKEYVYRLEEALQRTVAHYGITAHRVAGAPGLYVKLDDPCGHAALQGPASPADPWRGLGKIAALGIKVTRHCTYHGVALNVAMDLAPFERINPCGYAGLATVDLHGLGVEADPAEVAARLAAQLQRQFEPRLR